MQEDGRSVDLQLRGCKTLSIMIMARRLHGTTTRMSLFKMQWASSLVFSQARPHHFHMLQAPKEALTLVDMQLPLPSTRIYPYIAFSSKHPFSPFNKRVFVHSVALPVFSSYRSHITALFKPRKRLEGLPSRETPDMEVCLIERRKLFAL